MLVHVIFPADDVLVSSRLNLPLFTIVEPLPVDVTVNPFKSNVISWLAWIEACVPALLTLFNISIVDGVVPA